MPVFFVFLLKVNIALLLFCAGYYLVLRHLTFYTLNRIYLITALLFASVYPQINLSGFAERHRQITNPVQVVVLQLQAPAEILIKPLTQPNYWYWVEIVFWIGAGLLAIRLLVQLFSLCKLYSNSTATKLYDHNVRVINSDAPPFSFWKSIYVNPANHEPTDLKSILLHEQVHVNEWHTLDILLAELSTIFYWFNPGVWLIKKAVRENIEFITDRKILKNGVDSKTYQYSLVSVSFASTSHTIVNHFNISTVKKRIIMMNAKRSSTFNLTRYAFLVPGLVVLLLVFSISKAALIKKGTKAYKAFENTVGKIEKDVRPKNIAQATNISAANHKQIIINTPSNIKANRVKFTDSIRNGSIFINSSDTLSYVIDGVKVTKADFKALDPDHINSVDILSAEQAGKILDHVDAKHSVVFVTTDNSQAGEKFKEKIDNVAGNHFKATLRTLNAARLSRGGNIIAMGSARGRGGSAGRGTSVGRNSSVDTGYVNGRSIQPMATLTIPRMTMSLRLDSLKRRGGVSVYTTKRDTNIKGKRVTGVSIYGINGDTIYNKKRYGVGRIVYGQNMRVDSLMTRMRGKTLNGAHFLTFSDSTSHTRFPIAWAKGIPLKGMYNFQQSTKISGIQSKLIIIDGKEASGRGLKKLPASEIESLSVNSGDEVTKKYGDRAKNGVIFITTKKAN